MAADTPDRSATTRAVIPVGRPSSQAFARTRHAVITFATLAIGVGCWFGPAWIRCCPVRMTAAWPYAGHAELSSAARRRAERPVFDPAPPGTWCPPRLDGDATLADEEASVW